MSDKPTQKGLRDQAGDGYLNLLDSVRHSFEQAAWGQEATGNLGDDFYRWVGAAEDAPKAIEAAELAGGIEVRAVEPEPMAPAGRDWNKFADWIDGKREATEEHDVDLGRGREGPELGE